MSKIVGEVVAANADYVRGFGKKGDLPLPPARRFGIPACMDARLDPAKYAGLLPGTWFLRRNRRSRLQILTQSAVRLGCCSIGSATSGWC
jgi:carbonic anhydrase